MTPYVKTTWKDRIIQRPRTYSVTENADNTITLSPVTGTVTEAGTAVNAANLNNIENGLNAVTNEVNTVETQGLGVVKIGADTYTLRIGASGAAGYITIVLE